MKKAILLLTVMTAVVLICLCAMAETADQEKVLYRIESEGLYGYINRNGDVIVEPQYTIASLFDDYGYAAVKEPNGDEPGWCALLDWNGNVIARAPEIHHNVISYHLSFGDDETREGLFSPTTGTLIYYDGQILDDPVDDPNSTRVLVSPDDDHYGYLDRTTGEMVIPVQYDLVCIDWTQLSDPSGYAFIAYDFTCFHEGYAVVGQITGEDERRYWLIDETGKEIPLPGEPVTNVHEGKLNIWKDGDWYVCTVDGQIISEGYDEIRSYHNGYCGAINWRPHEPYKDDEDESQYDYPEFVMLNADGKEIYRRMGFIGHEKFCGFEVENGYYEIVERSVGEYTEIYNVEQGLVCTVPYMTELTDFNRKLMVVSYGYFSDFLCRLDGTPLRVLPHDACWNNRWEKDYFSECYSETPFYEDGLWLLCADNLEGKRRYGYLNEEFTWTVEPQFIRAEPFKHGMAWCTDEQGYDQYVDTQGRVVWKSGAPRDMEAEREILDTVGIWYRTDEENITHWLIMKGPEWGHCVYALSQDGIYREIKSSERDWFMQEYAPAVVTYAWLKENSWKKLDEPLREVSSVWHRRNEADDDDYLYLFADGTYEKVERPNIQTYDMLITDYGRIDGQEMISEMPGKTQRGNQVMRQENDLLICAAPGIADKTYRRVPLQTWEDYLTTEQAD